MQAGPSQPQRESGRAHRHRFESPFWREVMLLGVKHIPQPLQRATMPLWAGIFYALVPKARRTVEANLTRVLGEASPAVTHLRSYRLFINYAQSITNTYAAYLGQQLPVDPAFEGREKLLAAQAQGRGAIVVTGHLGYWSISPFVMERTGVSAPTMAMAEEPNSRLHRWEQQFRKKWKVVYTTGSPFASLELAAVLRRGEVVGMHIDRIVGGSFIKLPFFGKEAPFPLGPATLARATRAPLVPVFMVREGKKGFRARTEDPIEVAHTRDRERDLREATARAVAVYEAYVRRYPFQWFNFHDFWATPPEAAPPSTVEDHAVGANGR
jgi:Kdo2-lipid IVA lauroyltransferase/acyltransferase